MMADDDNVPLVESCRGAPDLVETRHSGIISIVEGTGRERLRAGNTGVSFPLRSTAKPFQLLPFLLDGLHESESSPVDAADISLMMSSHGDEPMHTRMASASRSRSPTVTRAPGSVPS